MIPKLKLALAPTFGGMVHDNYAHYRNTVPFCWEGMGRWCELVSEPEAELLHLGQIPVECYRPFNLPSSHVPMVCDLEGDYVAQTFRDEFNDILKSACSVPVSKQSPRLFCRPTMSRLLVHQALHDDRTFSPAKEHWLAFVGKSDTRSERYHMAEACVGLPAKIAINSTWHGHTALEHPARTVFEQAMLDCSIALCPQGEGIATARVYEACFYARCPAVIGTHLLLSYDHYDTSFCVQIESGLSPQSLRAEMEKLSGMPLAEAHDRGRLAREYFDKVVREYFRDPTLYFLNWLKKQGFWTP